MLVGDEEENGLADVSAADADVVQATQVAQGHAARLVDLVVADAKVIRRCGTNGWPIFRADAVR